MTDKENVKDFGELYESKKFPESEPLSGLVGAILVITKVLFYPTKFGDMAIITLVNKANFRTTSEVIVEQLAFVKRALDEGVLRITARLVMKTSFNNRDYMCLESGNMKGE